MIMTRTINIKTYLKFGLLGLLFVFIGVYSMFQIKALAKGVDLDISGITDGEVFTQNNLVLKGLALHASLITVNGKEVSVDQDSNFSEELVLSPGYNIIAIEAKDKFNKSTQEVYRVSYNEQPTAPQIGALDSSINTNQ
jgi:hypothetical protein